MAGETGQDLKTIRARLSTFDTAMVVFSLVVTPHASLILACATMLILLVLNYRGVKPGARVQNLLSILKIVMIVGLAVLALLIAPRTTAVEPRSDAPAALRLASAPAPYVTRP
jgi:amino acid transporter